MATETLIDNKPPLHDKLHDLPAADEPKPQEEEDALTEVDESKETKEIDGHDDSEKDEEKDDGDEGTDEDDEVKGSRLRKEATSEKKSPVTPTSDRPTRERKLVERYSEPSPAKFGSSASSKALVIEKGRGAQLKDIPNVAFKLSKRKPDDTLNMLHKLLFGKSAKAHTLKRNIGQFSGYVWAENEEKQRIKVKERIDKFVKDKLADFCDVLNIPITKCGLKKEDLSAKLLEFLESPHATTDVLLAEKKQKAKKKRTRKATPGKSPREASKETLAKKKKPTPQSGKKRKLSSDVEDDDKAELSDAKDESHEDEDVAVANNETDDEVGKSEEEKEEDISKAHKSKSKQSGKEDSVAKAEAKTPSVKKTSAKATQSSEKSPKKSKQKKTNTDHDSASLPKSNQPDTKKLKTGKEKPETKEKDAIKTSKAVKGKSSKKIKVEEPSREDMHSVVANILKEVDFNTATLSDILRQLGTHFGLDLMHRKAEVKNIITDVINSMSDEEGDGEEAESDGDGDEGVDGGGDVSEEDDNV